MYEVLKGVPMPRTRRLNLPKRKYPFREMAVGDSFFIPNKTKNTLMTMASSEGKRLGCKFSTKICWMIQTPKGWKLAADTDEGAVQGVGCWRIA
jgi:hypothetical protein